MDLFRFPSFYTNMDNQECSTREQVTLIRQGCTLSPYLFRIAMSGLTKSVRETEELQLQAAGRIRGASFGEVLFADDTLILADKKARADMHLHLIERAARYYGLALNRTKCKLLRFNTAEDVILNDSTPAQASREITHLGVTINDSLSAQTHPEVHSHLEKVESMLEEIKDVQNNQCHHLGRSHQIKSCATD